MNIQVKAQGATASRPLIGKVSLVTGSTSGIGLGIARALAEAGSAVVLNGFGLRRRDRQNQGPAIARFRREGKLFGRRYDEAGGDRGHDRGDAR